MKAKHILLICTSFSYHHVVKNLGYEVSILCHVNSRSAVIASGIQYHTIQFFETEEDRMILAEKMNELLSVDLVFSFDEMFFRSALSLSNHWGLPYPLTEMLITKFEDKLLMRNILRKKNIEHLPVSVCHNVKEISDFGFQHGYPIVLKPRIGVGSSGVTLIQNPKEIQEAVEWFKNKDAGVAEVTRQSNDMLVELFIPGQEYSVEAFSENGEHHLICVVKKFKEGKHFVGEGHLLPAPVSQRAQEILFKATVQLLNALEYQNGPSHTEIILSGEKAVIVESHPRVSGAAITTVLIPLVYKINPIKYWLKQQFGEKTLSAFKRTQQNGYAAIRFQSALNVGVVQEIKGVDEAKAMDDIVEVGVMIKVGDKFDGLKNSYSRLSYAISKSSTAEKAGNTAKIAVEKIRFKMV